MQEDFLTSLHMAAEGWETVYLTKENVQWGLAPDTFAGWVKQRQRWAAGIISISQYLCSERAMGLATDVRFVGSLWGVIDSSAAFVWTVALVGLPVLVTMQEALVAWKDSTQLNLLLALALVDFTGQSWMGLLLSSLLDFKMPFLGQFASAWTAPYRVIVALRFYVLPKLLGYKTPNFTPTNLLVHGEQERAVRIDRSLISCLRVIILGCGAYLHLAVFVVCVTGGILTMSSVVLQFETKSVSFVLQRLMAGVCWPPLFVLWAALMKNAWVPVAYAISCPALMSREHFLVRDGGNGVMYPSAKAKGDHLRRGGQKFFCFACLYYALAIIAYGLT